MTCSTFEQSIYQFYAMGVLDGMEADQVGTHLAIGCETCRRGVRNGVLLTYLLARGTAEKTSTDRPSAECRNRVLNYARSSSATSPAYSKNWWAQPVAASVMFGLMSGSWYMGRVSSRRTEPQPLLVAESTSEMENLRARVQVAEESAARKEAATAVTPGPVAVPVIKGTDLAELRAVKGELTAAKEKLGEMTATLTAEQGHVVQLEGELGRLRTAHNSLEQEKQKLEVAYRERSTDGERLADAQRRLVLLTRQIAELERKNTQYSLTITRQRRDMDQSVAMINFLSSPTLKSVRLLSTDKGGKALGHAFVNEGQKLVFRADNLPALRAGRSYQLWVIRDHSPAIVSAGVFQPMNGQATVEFEGAGVLRGVRALAVSEEPEGGSKLPTGQKIIIGSVKL